MKILFRVFLIFYTGILKRKDRVCLFASLSRIFSMEIKNGRVDNL